MLPQTLAKEKCSLKPGQLRLTFSVVMKYSPDGEFLDLWVGKGYIRSACRLTYEQADVILSSQSLSGDNLASHIPGSRNVLPLEDDNLASHIPGSRMFYPII